MDSVKWVLTSMVWMKRAFLLSFEELKDIDIGTWKHRKSFVSAALFKYQHCCCKDQLLCESATCWWLWNWLWGPFYGGWGWSPFSFSLDKGSKMIIISNGFMSNTSWSIIISFASKWIPWIVILWLYVSDVLPC